MLFQMITEKDKCTESYVWLKFQRLISDLKRSYDWLTSNLECGMIGKQKAATQKSKT